MAAASPTRFNTKSPAVKRIMQEMREMQNPTESYYAQPLEDNLFEWHFTVRGAPDTPFAHGVYHGRILLPAEYPFKPPSIILTTPNGRFEVDKKICLSISAYHPEFWQPSWSIRTVLLAIISFMPTEGKGAIGALDVAATVRQELAKQSVHFKCPVCQKCNRDLLLPEAETPDLASAPSAADLSAIREIAFKGEDPNARSRTSSAVTEAEQADAQSLAQSTAAPVSESSAPAPEPTTGPQTPSETVQGVFPAVESPAVAGPAFQPTWGVPPTPPTTLTPQHQQLFGHSPYVAHLSPAQLYHQHLYQQQQYLQQQMLHHQMLAQHQHRQWLLQQYHLQQQHQHQHQHQQQMAAPSATASHAAAHLRARTTTTTATSPAAPLAQQRVHAAQSPPSVLHQIVNYFGFVALVVVLVLLSKWYAV
ncbi:ubiquitin-conjugating enzyme E2 [Capsaspora owczarzaki ATCC 30864]|uniref:Ubiquitin-conjugating enzyme E2 n=1 Tax=Capsaspora owczarzaki (strain ATCC 30864) TaxID=595528 RepID=A0A0D2USG8_CAPO3|nr:ubiquitin-conjugating enzyme E2 [Capsaspora owczarzaki ATCC 30864]KJE97921.1 ubiquitin-conjugating enzyme E2 [Capsaspora owczarzaki ATCC 30864]|eukprot:XP_004342591.2 ubiquitin-conjugating enzyme E2 [Capsaspora owczarzaki ATCC 30864]